MIASNADLHNKQVFSVPSFSSGNAGPYDVVLHNVDSANPHATCNCRSYERPCKHATFIKEFVVRSKGLRTESQRRKLIAAIMKELGYAVR